MIAYKLMRVRKDESIGPLFINRKHHIRIGETHIAKHGIHQKGYKYRPGWHCLPEPYAPHLKLKEDRAWVKVLISQFTIEDRPESQGGKWFLAEKITFLEFVPPKGQ